MLLCFKFVVSAAALLFRLDLDCPADANTLNAASASKALAASAAGAALSDSDNDETMQDVPSSDQQSTKTGVYPSLMSFIILSTIQLA